MSLVCWSGGLDSTLVLHQLAVEQRDGVKAHSVRALTITHPQVSCHQPSAAAARAAVKEAFRKAGLIVNYIDVTIGQAHEGWTSEQFIGAAENPQSLLWLTTAVNYLGRDEDLYTGYIRGDDYWHRADRAQAAFAALQALAGNTGAMRHPLEWESKADVVRGAKKLDLYRHCWWCEEQYPKVVRGKARPCGKCKSCLTNDTALWQLSREPPGA